jgi:hypothetical protein
LLLIAGLITLVVSLAGRWSLLVAIRRLLLVAGFITLVRRWRLGLLIGGRRRRRRRALEHRQVAAFDLGLSLTPVKTEDGKRGNEPKEKTPTRSAP